MVVSVVSGLVMDIPGLAKPGIFEMDGTRDCMWAWALLCFCFDNLFGALVRGALVEVLYIKTHIPNLPDATVKASFKVTYYYLLQYEFLI